MGFVGAPSQTVMVARQQLTEKFSWVEVEGCDLASSTLRGERLLQE